MSGLVGKLAVRFLKGRWGSILPALLRALAEGKFGETPKAIYWKTAGYRTLTGAALSAVAVGAGQVCGSYPDYAWSCDVAKYALAVGVFLAGVGLADGGTRAPWPEGTPKDKA